MDLPAHFAVYSPEHARMKLTYFIYLQLSIRQLIKHFTVIYADANKQLLTLNLIFFGRDKISISGTPISLPKIADLPIWAQENITYARVCTNLQKYWYKLGNIVTKHKNIAFSDKKYQHAKGRQETFKYNNPVLNNLQSFLADRNQQWGVIISCCCHIWSSTEHSAWTSPVPGIHQWPALKSFLFSTTFCWWLSTVQSHTRSTGCSVTTDRS